MGQSEAVRSGDRPEPVPMPPPTAEPAWPRPAPMPVLVSASASASNPSAAPGDRLEPVGPGALRWALVAAASVAVGIEVLGLVARWLDRDLRAGSTAAFALGAAALAMTDVIVFVALRYFAHRRAAMTARSLGLRRPESVGEAAVLGIATWVCFLLFAAVWVVLTTPKAELDRIAERARTTASRPAGARTPTTAPASKTEPSSVGSSKRSPAKQAEPVRDDRHVLIKALANHPPARVVIVILLVACLGAPIFEELFFRGFLFRAVAGRFGFVVGAAASGALFGLAHVRAVPLRNTVPLAVMGVALAWLFHATGSIVPGMLVHGFVNALGTGVSAGFGWHTATLIVCTWAVLVLILLPWLRSLNPSTSDPVPSLPR